MDIVEERKLAEEVRELRLQKDLAESFKRLSINPDFRKVIENHYLNSYAVSLVLAKANPAMTVEQQILLEHKLNSIATFSRFLSEMENLVDTIDVRLADASHSLQQITL